MRNVLAMLAASFVLTSLAACATTHAIEVQSIADGELAGGEAVTVELSNFAYAPETLTLNAGQAYALTVANTASGGHTFTAPEFFAAARIARSDAGTVAKGEIDLAGGETAVIHLIPSAGNYDLVCTHFGHAALGMKGHIVVN